MYFSAKVLERSVGLIGYTVEKLWSGPMNMKPDCLACLYTQMLRVTKAVECSESCATEVMEESAERLAHLRMDQTPPEAAAILYPAASEAIGEADPYRKKKAESIEKARRFLPGVRERIAHSTDPLDAALRAAAAGNVIDFATEVSFDLEKEIDRIFEAEFGWDDKAGFLERLGRARRLAVIGDNVGEHLFDKVMMERFRAEYPELEIDYFVRGRPIINDVTVTEAREAGIDEVARIVDSGVDTPGFLPERASEEGRTAYERADLILAKGMGNFECMESWADARVFFLFKVKCSVVAAKVGREVGDLVCLAAEHYAGR